MARPLRLEYDGAIYHVISRGNAHQEVFHDDRDRIRFLEILNDVVRRYHWICHAYCLMTNHHHLLVETPEAGLSRGMQLLNSVYAQWFNRRHARAGHLFQGRFKSIVVEKESYLLEVARYVVLNPVRAGMVAKAHEWPWSSYRATAGLADSPAFLTVDWILSQLGDTREEATLAYRRFVAQGRDGFWEDLRAGWILGSDQFVDRIRPLIREKPLDPEYRRCERFAARPSLEELFEGVEEKAMRNERIYEAVRRHRYRLREVSDVVGLLYSTISMIAKRVQESKKSEE